MKNSIAGLALLGLLLAGAGCAPRPAGDTQPLRVTQADGAYVVTEGPDSVLVYRRQPEFPEREHARRHFIHPLYGLNGQVLTENFPEDHLHHHGVFWAWHQILVNGRRVGDAWTQDHFVWDVQEVQVLEEGENAVLKAQVLWKSPQWTDEHGDMRPFVRETTTLRVHPSQGDYRAIDVEIALEALEEDVRIGGSENKKGYGGLSARIRLPDDIRFTGPEGSVEPSTYQVDAGPWLDFSGTFGGRQAGLAILEHPDQPGYPQPWILRRSGSMQNVAYPGREPVRLPREEPLVLRYRFIIHRGDAQRIDLEQLHDEYAGE